MTEDTLNIEEIKMHKKTISKILVALLMTSMILSILPALQVGATTLTSISPVSGNVGTTVRVVGTIDTLGGAYSILFDTTNNGLAWPGDVIVTGNAPANSYVVNVTFTIPSCLGSDAGLNHLVGLRDTQTTTVQSTNFAVVTSRVLTVSPSRVQEGDTVNVTMTVTGGTIANQVNNYTIYVTDPNGTTYSNFNMSFQSDSTGAGTALRSYPATFSTGANSNFVGTHSLVADRTLPGAITSAAIASFVVGLTNATSYGRFQTVNVQTAGWANNQNVTITITNTTGGIAQQWANLNLTTGTTSQNWTIPWNAPMGTYTVTATNATGNDKDVISTQTFTVGSAALAVAFTIQPVTPLNRTSTVVANFTIRYPDNTLYNTTHFSSIMATIYANTTAVATVSLTSANYNSATGTWRVSWKIPRNASLGTGYTIALAIGDIADTNANSGPTAAVPSTAFTVTMAALSVTVTQQPAANYTRTSTVMAKINITYPDNTFFTDADLGSVLVRVNRNGTNIANVTLVADNFNSTTNDWTIGWTSAYNAVLGSGYNFTVLINEAVDGTTTNNGPKADVSTSNTTLLTININVADIQTNSATYQPGEYATIFFDATYANGAPVVTGTSTVTLTAPDTFTTVTVNPVHTTAGRWQVVVWLSDAQAQIGAWNVALASNGLNDGAGNSGPTTAITTNFTVLEADVTLETLLAAINALDARLDDVEADTSGLDAAVSSLSTAINNVKSVVDAIGSSVATASEVAALDTALDALSTEVATIKTNIASLSTAVANAASDSDVAAVSSNVAAVSSEVAAVSSAVDSLSADLAALETSVANLNTAIDAAATPADVDNAVDAAVSDLSSEIGGLNTMVIIAVVLALIAAIAAILAVYIIQRKIAG